MSGSPSGLQSTGALILDGPGRQCRAAVQPWRLFLRLPLGNVLRAVVPTAASYAGGYDELAACTLSRYRNVLGS